MKDYEQLYKQMKVAVQDLLIECGWSSQDIKDFAEGTKGQSNMPSSKVCAKLLDAGLLE